MGRQKTFKPKSGLEEFQQYADRVHETDIELMITGKNQTKLQRWSNQNPKGYLMIVGTYGLTRNNNDKIWQKKCRHGFTTPNCSIPASFSNFPTSNNFHSRGELFMRKKNKTKRPNNMVKICENWRKVAILRTLHPQNHWFQNLLLPQSTKTSEIKYKLKKRSPWN